MSSALAPDITGPPQVLIQSVSHAESEEGPILLVVHRWHKDRAGCVNLGGYLWEEPQPGKQRHTSIGRPDIRGLAGECVHLRRSASGGDSKQEGSFPGQVLFLSGQIIMGSNGAQGRHA